MIEVKVGDIITFYDGLTGTILAGVIIAIISGQFYFFITPRLPYYKERYYFAFNNEILTINGIDTHV